MHVYTIIVVDYSPKVDMEYSYCSQSSVAWNNNYDCYAAIDGNSDSLWATEREAAGAWIQIDFDDTYQISKMLFMHYDVRYMFKDITLEFSSGSPAYSTLRDFSNVPQHGRYFMWSKVDIPGKRITKFVKVTATSATSSTSMGFREIVIFGGSLPGIICEFSNNIL